MAATNKISLKLFIDKKRNRVLFAEAGKDFVEFLFQSFTLPVVTVTNFLKSEDMLGCLQNLYKSIENLSHNYTNCIWPGQSKDLVLKPKLVMSGATDSGQLLPRVESYTNCIWPGQSKDLVLKPKLVMSGATDSGQLLPRVESYTFRKFYKCQYVNHDQLSSKEGGYCYSCSSALMSREVSLSVEELISGNTAISNFNLLKERVRFIVKDDLRMTPMSTDAFITLLHEYDMKDLRALEKKEVDLDMDRSVKLLKAALQSKTALTDVFLHAEQSIKNAVELI